MRKTDDDSLSFVPSTLPLSFSLSLFLSFCLSLPLSFSVHLSLEVTHREERKRRGGGGVKAVARLNLCGVYVCVCVFFFVVRFLLLLFSFRFAVKGEKVVEVDRLWRRQVTRPTRYVFISITRKRQKRDRISLSFPIFRILRNRV